MKSRKRIENKILVNFPFAVIATLPYTDYLATWYEQVLNYRGDYDYYPSGMSRVQKKDYDYYPSGMSRV